MASDGHHCAGHLAGGIGSAGRRKAGFWIFLASNALWVAWGLHTGGWALVVLHSRWRY
jgi:hypothetical protein